MKLLNLPQRKELTSEEAVPTTKSFDPLRCAIKIKSYQMVSNINIKETETTSCKTHHQVLHTRIAPNLCIKEYDVPERATCREKMYVIDYQSPTKFGRNRSAY